MSNLEEENKKLKEELVKSRRNEVTPEMWLGGAIGVVIYIIYKGMNGYGWHAGDVVGIFLLAFLPGVVFISQLFNFKKDK